jgi:putative Mg2+ transporter-C (MgtC) family protein
LSAAYLTPVDGHFVAGLVFAMVAGFLIGYERGSRGEPAGVRTHMLVCIGAMLFSTVSQYVDDISPSRIAANVVVGMGFLGAGLIMQYKGSVHGLTSAASLWLIAAVGIAIGYGFYIISFITMITAFLILKLPHIGEQQDAITMNAYNTISLEKKRSKAKGKR